MTQQFINKPSSDKLLLIFAGWGMDGALFEDLSDCDICVCYNYRTLEFDLSQIAKYSTIDVLAWSMGVWVAAVVLPQLTVHHSVAVNGTHSPIDATRGIHPVVFDGTLNNLSDESIKKFWRRMCSNSAQYQWFIERAPRRELSCLRAELAALRSHYGNMAPVNYDWDEVIIGRGDRIFTPENQLNAWQDHKNVVVCDMAHLPDFKTLAVR